MSAGASPYRAYPLTALRGPTSKGRGRKGEEREREGQGRGGDGKRGVGGRGLQLKKILILRPAVSPQKISWHAKANVESGHTLGVQI